ncbi:MAG: multiprotein-bridging factor 1 family protein [Streptosporangiales bacterium]
MSKRRSSEPGDSPLVMFAKELRAHRELAGLSQVQLGDRIAYSPSLVAKIETCGQVASRDFGERYDEVLGTPGTLTRMQRQCTRVAYPGWFWSPRGWTGRPSWAAPIRRTCGSSWTRACCGGRWAGRR